MRDSRVTRVERVTFTAKALQGLLDPLLEPVMLANSTPHSLDNISSRTLLKRKTLEVWLQVRYSLQVSVSSLVMVCLERTKLTQLHYLLLLIPKTTSEV
jgi:hypothetical protein